jgi:peptidoglycan/LPS O-acetylase OafA/YrhL
MGRVTVRRLRRILVPYAFASVLAQIWWAVQGAAPNTGSWVTDLLYGASMGPYYFVFLIVGLVFATPVFARLSDRGMALTTVLLLAAQWWYDAAAGVYLSFFWAVRNPLMWWAYFAVGWLVRRHHAAILAWLTPRRGWILPVLIGLVLALSAASGLDGPRVFVRTAVWLDVYATCALIFAATAGRESIPTAVRYLSEASYTIYLLHIVFILVAAEFVPPTPLRTEWLPIVVPWAAGLFGSLAVIAGLRALLGRHSRDWIGA